MQIDISRGSLEKLRTIRQDLRVMQLGDGGYAAQLLRGAVCQVLDVLFLEAGVPFEEKKVEIVQPLLTNANVTMLGSAPTVIQKGDRPGVQIIPGESNFDEEGRPVLHVDMDRDAPLRTEVVDPQIARSVARGFVPAKGHVEMISAEDTPAPTGHVEMVPATELITEDSDSEAARAAQAILATQPAPKPPKQQRR